MQEGLRSIHCSKEGRIELDLNVEPIEEAEDTFITTVSGSHQNCDVQSLGNNFEERGIDGFHVNAESDNGCVEELESVKYDLDVDTCIRSDVTTNSDPCNGTAMPERKRKEGEELEMDNEASKGNIDNIGFPIIICLAAVKEEPIMAVENNVGMEYLKLEGDRSGQIVTVEGANSHDDANGGCNESKQVPEKKRRGRKRKNAANAESHNDDVKRKKDIHLPLAGATGSVGRVLRSRMIGISQAKIQIAEDDSCFAAVEVLKEPHKPENVQSHEALLLRDTESAPPCGPGREKVKGRRGRPPKIRNNDQVAPPIRKDKKKVKGRRGRPPKMPAKGSPSETVTNQSDQVTESKDKFRCKKNGKVIKSSMFSKSQLESTEPQLVNDENGEPMKSIKLKEVDTGRRVQQQAVRDQIVDILMKAGWTVQYRPRQARQYNDAVYVDCQGKTHWSVTLAYRKLREKVNNGTADDKTLSAFTVIPEEVLRTLFRTRRKNQENKLKKEKGGKSNKKKNSNEPSLDAEKVTHIPKCKEKLNANPKLRDKFPKKSIKTNAHNRDDHLMKKSKRGRSGSKRDGRNRKPCALLVRKSEEMSDQVGEGFMLYDGKRNLLSWMIDSGTIQSSAQVQYVNAMRTEVMREGKITGDGIFCGCCGQTLTLLDFESHAGSTLCQPLEHICLVSGCSLLQCLAESWCKLEESDPMKFHLVNVDDDDPNDDTCNICGDGGDLICCDSCPSTFHQNCLNIQKLPSGNWRCVYCSCKFCGTVAGKSCHVDDHMTVSELPLCHLCEERFHFACNQDETADNLDSKDLIFCGKRCEKLFEGLQALLGVKHDMDEGFSWTVLHRHSVGKDENRRDTNNSLKVECNSKLAVAFSVMDECFMPIVDQRSKINMIHNVVYNCGSNFKRLNYCGFYTFILEKGDELVAAASIRLHGNLLAEMPFIGTRYKYRRQGMCRRLIGAIETALCSLGIKQLVIPAISDLIETWTKIFGFAPLEESMRREMMRMSIIVFPGTDMLQKPIPKLQATDDHIMSADASEASSELDLNKSIVSDESHATSSQLGFLQDVSDMKTVFESFIPKEALRVQ